MQRREPALRATFGVVFFFYGRNNSLYKNITSRLCGVLYCRAKYLKKCNIMQKYLHNLRILDMFAIVRLD